MPMQVITGPIVKAGQSLSEPLIVDDKGIYRIIMPTEWNSADITFMLSYNGTDFYNVFDVNGMELVMPCVPNSVVPLGDYLRFIHSVKIRSGSIREPIAQTADRTFRLVLDTKPLAEVGAAPAARNKPHIRRR